jgi:hypothetical protein
LEFFTVRQRADLPDMLIMPGSSIIRVPMQSKMVSTLPATAWSNSPESDFAVGKKNFPAEAFSLDAQKLSDADPDNHPSPHRKARKNSPEQMLPHSERRMRLDRDNKRRQRLALTCAHAD